MIHLDKDTCLENDNTILIFLFDEMFFTNTMCIKKKTFI